MKKVVSLMLCCLMVMAAGAFPVSADFQESVNFSFDEAEHGLYDSSNGITPYASGLLTAYKLTIGTSGGKLAVSAYTEGVMEATKVGFTYVRIDKSAEPGGLRAFIWDNGGYLTRPKDANSFHGPYNTVMQKDMFVHG